MTIFKTVDSSVLSLIILFFLYFHLHNDFKNSFLHQKIFLSLVQLNIGLLIIDILSWPFNTKPGITYLIANYSFNLLLFLIEPFVPMLWIIYVQLKVYKDETSIQKLKIPFTVALILNALVSIASLHTHWFFYVTSANVYHRGTFYWVHILLCLSFLLYSCVFVQFNQARLEKKQYLALLFFAIPPLLGTMVQVLFYGISLTWSGMMLSLLIAYLYIQDDNLNTDYLTGIYNRRQLDSYVRKKISSSSKENSFSVILIDLNDFKQINDVFGHDVGDEALRNAVKVIQSCLWKEDFVARYGGDEFYIIFDLSNPITLESKVEQIHRAVQKFNSEEHQPYQLSFCMGYDVYRYEDQLTSDDFLKHIDRMMYQNKQIIKNSGLSIT